MAFVLADKVREAVNAPGTSDFELLGPPPSADTLTFASQIGDGNTTRYQAWGAEGWEIGIGTVSTGATNRLLRPGTVLINSSGGTSLIDFQGAVQVACVFSTADLPYHDENGDVPARGGRDLGTEADPWRDLWLSRDIYSANITVSGAYSVGRDVDDSYLQLFGGLLGNLQAANIVLRGEDASQGPEGILQSEGSGQLRWDGDGVQIRGPSGYVPAAGVSQSTSASETTFPVGHPLLVSNDGAFVGRNGTTVPCIADNSFSAYVLSGSSNAGSPLTGTWRSCGSRYGDGFNISQLRRAS